MAVISMSKREFDQLEVLLRVQSGRLRVAGACALLGRSRRQVFRLLRGIRDGGAASLVSKRRGKPSNRRLPDAVRELAMSLVREHYSDFGPTFAAEKLAERHGCTVSRETLRSWMIADGLWLDRRARLRSPHQPRRRLHLAGVCGRRDQPADAAAVCCERVGVFLLRGDPGLPGGARQARSQARARASCVLLG